MGADINAKLGVQDGENYKDILGLSGFNDRNSKGEHLLDMYGGHNLRVAVLYPRLTTLLLYQRTLPKLQARISKELQG